MIEYIPYRENGRIFAAGDLHGCYHQLVSLLTKVAFDEKNDLLILVGDLCDRGPQSEECFKLIDKPWVKAIRGNHEEIFIDSCDTRGSFNWDNWITHGGQWAHDMPFSKRWEYGKKIVELPVVIVVGEGENRVNIFHAEFHGSDADLDALADKDPRIPPLSLQWGVELFKGNVSPDKHKGLSPSYVGHRISPKIHQIGSHIYIDTGAFMEEVRKDGMYGLSMVNIQTKEVYRFKY